MTHATSELDHDIQPGHIAFWQGARAHRRAALGRMVQVSVVLTLVFVAIYMADYLMQFAGGGLQSNVLFFGSLVMMSMLLGFALGLSRYARTEKWTLDRIQRELRVERFTFGKSSRVEAIDLKHVRALHCGEHMLEAVLDDMQRITLVESAQRAAIAELGEKIESFCTTHNLALDVTR